MERIKAIAKAVVLKVSEYLGVWAWEKPLNWTDPFGADWIPSWLCNYIVAGSALVLGAVALIKLL